LIDAVATMPGDGG